MLFLSLASFLLGLHTDLDLEPQRGAPTTRSQALATESALESLASVFVNTGTDLQ